MVDLSTYCSMATSGWDSRTKKMCCWARLPEYNNYHEMHQDQKVIKLLADLKTGLKNPICCDCWKAEDINARSMRQQRIENKTEKELHKEMEDRKIKHLVIDSGSQCNFACRTCGPWSSTGHYKEWETRNGKAWSENKIKTTDIQSLLEQDLSGVESVEVLGGEPFINLDHLQIIKKISKTGASANCTLSYITNGSVKLRSNILDTFDNFQSVNISLSIDAVGKKFNYIRTLGKWEDVVNNVEILQGYKQTHKNLSLSAHPTVSALNVLYVDELFDWFRLQDLPFTLVFCTDPKEYSMEIFNAHQKEKIIDILELNSAEMKKEIINHLRNTQFVPQSFTAFQNATKFTEQYRKLLLKDYLPGLYELLN